jgi:hypothetical protein
MVNVVPHMSIHARLKKYINEQPMTTAERATGRATQKHRLPLCFGGFTS